MLFYHAGKCCTDKYLDSYVDRMNQATKHLLIKNKRVLARVDVNLIDDDESYVFRYVIFSQLRTILNRDFRRNFDLIN